MSLKDKLLESPAIYSVWAAGLDTAKIQAIERMLPDLEGKRVLDIGCGPANNTALFLNCDYTGIDLNPQYIQVAQKRFPQRAFLIQDVQDLDLPKGSFDLILINSMLHHISDALAGRLFEQLYHIIQADGHVILSEPLTPYPNELLKRMLMRLDRGDYFRSYDAYCHLFDKYFSVEQQTQYPLKMLGITGWRMVVMRMTRIGY